MITKDAYQFLAETPPFSSLEEQSLRKLSREMQLEYHPRGACILRQDGPVAEHLSIILSGAVKIFTRTNEGEELLVDYRSGGECFGLLSFLCGAVSMNTVIAAENTCCYLIKRETIHDLIRKDAGFSAACLLPLLKKLVEMTYHEIRDRTLLYGGGDKLLFTNVLGDLATRKVVTASEEVSIREAARIMADHRISSLVLVDTDGLPSGMVTDRDLRNKVVSRGRDVTARVGDIMSATLIKAEAGDYCFEALIKMIRYNIHHLLVTDKGALKGILTNHDLMMLQGVSPLTIAAEIENQDTIDGLAPVAKKIGTITTILIREGARAGTITRIITEINDRLLKKVLEITEARVGKPPLDYCWIVYGSEGRKEQTFRTDQDNAIVYDDPEEKSNKDVERYFSEFSHLMKDSLTRCGFPPCPADYMASNPRWRRPFSAWKKLFSNWINTPTPEALLNALTLFDFRSLHGDTLLAEKLRAFLGRELKDKSLFLAHMAGHAVKNRPPLDFFGRIRCEKKGSRQGTLDIKVNGLAPIIDAVRLSALETKVYSTSTLERLRELKDRDCTIGKFAPELEQAFEFLLSLRLRHQFQQIEERVEPDNFINPSCLGSLEQTMLKESFKLILAVQDAILNKYGSLMVL